MYVKIESLFFPSISWILTRPAVSSDVFVSVSQDLSSEGNQKVKLEYALPRDVVLLNLFLQAMRERKGDTGVDVIWKYEW